MHNLSKLALAGALAAGLAGTAVAAARSVHVMTVPLPNGTVVHVQYVGDVTPRVTIAPVAPVAILEPGRPAGFALPGIDSVFEQIDRQMAASMQQMDALSRQATAAGPASANLASYGSLPPGTTSFSTVTINENGRQCSRSTTVIGEGPGKPSKVSTNVSGDCGPARHGAAPAAVPSGPVHQS